MAQSSVLQLVKEASARCVMWGESSLWIERCSKVAKKIVSLDIDSELHFHIRE